MLELILGRGGSGKSTMILERAAQSADDGNRVLLLVPEQFSFATERKLLSLLGGRSLLGVSVLSFSRLCENVFRHYGGLAGKRLDDMSRLVLMKLAVHETGDLLDIYSRQSKRTDFLSTMLETIDELKSSGCYPTQLRDTIATLAEGQLRHKLTDIATVYEVYQGIVERSYQDPHDDISRAVARVRGGGFFAGYHVYIDGFDFFSPPERQLIDCVLEQCEQLTIALTADRLGEGGELDIFHDPKAAAQRLIARAGELGIPCRKPTVLADNRRTAVPALLAVEHFAATGERVSPCSGAGLTITAAHDKYEEVRLAAAGITKLVREHGYRYRDIAVVARSLGEYETALDSIFGSFAIPLFFDKREPVTASPIVAVVTAALDAMRGDWKTEAILRIARCPAVGISMEQAALLENYLYIWSIDGKDWDKPFTGSPSGLDHQPTTRDNDQLAELEALRQRLVTPLAQLRGVLHGCTGSEFALGVYSYLVATDAVAHLREHFAGDDKGLADTDNLYSLLVDILDLFADSMGGVGLSATTFVEMFDLAVSCIELGSIPNTNDQTIAGSADRIRLDSPRAVFVLGVNEGVFPARYQPYGVFSDTERELLLAHGVELSASRFQRALLERFFLYSTLAAPAERLCISYSTATLSGTTQEPSLTVTQLAQLFPDSAVSGVLDDSDYVIDLFTAREQYVRRHGSDRPAGELRQALADEGDGTFLALMDKLSTDSPAEGIAPATATALIGGKLHLSPTRIEEFYSCPYLYFCKNMLRLRPRKRVEYTPLESGSAVHYVLEKLLTELGGSELAAIGDDDLRERISKLLSGFISSVTTDTSALRSRFTYQFGRLVSVLVLLVRHIGDDFAQSLFTPAGMEVAVATDGTVKPLSFTASNGTDITVNGKIDRVDLFVDGEDRYARVVDYKSGNKEFSLSEVFYGLNMQMLIYLFALCADPDSRFGKVQPAGILYMPGKVSPVNTRSDTAQELLRSLIDDTLQMKGLLLEDEKVLRAMERELAGRYIPVRTNKNGTLSAKSKVKSAAEFARLRTVVEDNISGMGESLVGGSVGPLPARSGKVNPCNYCDYGLLCHNCNTLLCRDISGGEQDEEVAGDGDN